MDTSFYEFHLKIDGEERTIKSSTLLIGSTNSIGGFESILPEATVNDGLLHLLYLKDKNLLDTLVSVPDLISGNGEESNNIEYLTFKEITVELADDKAELSVNVDGDEGDQLPVTIRVLPSHLNVYY